ncbi:uncharacterized protein BX664DRAFT_312740 [Halteromyces radiatus]|uniref:uncharacterized protein n=1 Tax=Halteromyces radiatus TaxID=101107 RepID=UPI0022200D82|nr:uncharacterized protein BX664DRAFT_312740 [Halteromyces radiatus]KAI8092615.1 hypothetical protein BX664DRAFT_312740 [Halteromyces radiatus]
MWSLKRVVPVLCFSFTDHLIHNHLLLEDIVCISSGQKFSKNGDMMEDFFFYWRKQEHSCMKDDGIENLRKGNIINETHHKSSFFFNATITGSSYNSSYRFVVNVLWMADGDKQGIYKEKVKVLIKPALTANHKFCESFPCARWGGSSSICLVISSHTVVKEYIGLANKKKILEVNIVLWWFLGNG